MTRLNVNINATDNKLSTLAISCASSGDNVLIAGVSGQIIRVYKMFFVPTSAVVATLKDGTLTALTGAAALLAGAQFQLGFDTAPWFETSAGNGFVLNLGAGIQCSGAVYYTQS